MIIRKAETKDAGVLFLLARAFATSFTVEQPVFDRTYAELLMHSDAFLAVAEVDGAVAGYVLGFDHLTFFANGRIAWVEELMVGEASRRHGVGRRLMEAFEEWAVSRDVKLTALATRRAAEFYGALGYEESAAYFCKKL